jgi:hypothetical protein
MAHESISSGEAEHHARKHGTGYGSGETIESTAARETFARAERRVPG